MKFTVSAYLMGASILLDVDGTLLGVNSNCTFFEKIRTSGLFFEYQVYLKTNVVFLTLDLSFGMKAIFQNNQDLFLFQVVSVLYVFF